MFIAHDLSVPLIAGRKFDLVISTEVAEHLEETAAESLVRSLVGLGDGVLFSAAIPDPGGTGHVNERWPEYWSKLFVERDFHPCDVLRPHLWNRGDIDYWYAQNLILFMRNGAADWIDAFSSSPTFPCLPHPQALVHPRVFLLRTTKVRDMLEHRTGFGVRWCLVELYAAIRDVLFR